jgi:hypothetical protein
MPAPTLPQVATLNQNTVVSWSNGDAFNGYLLIGLVLPQGGTTYWAEVDLGGQSPGERIPLFQRVAIVNGQFENNVGVIYTTSLSPPNTRYVCWYYDQSVYPPRQIAGPSPVFTVTSTPLTPPSLTLTAPIIGSVIPDPSYPTQETAPMVIDRVYEVPTLSANTVITAPFNAVLGARLTIYVTQGSGQYTISFDPSQFAQVINTAISEVDGDVSVFDLSGRSDGLWWPTALPMTGLDD